MRRRDGVALVIRSALFVAGCAAPARPGHAEPSPTGNASNGLVETPFDGTEAARKGASPERGADAGAGRLPAEDESSCGRWKSRPVVAGGECMDGNQGTMHECACRKLGETQLGLERVEREIRSRHAAEPDFLRQFVRAQAAWKRAVEEDMELVFLGPAKASQYGTAYPMCECFERSELTSARVTYLREWLTAEEGDVCRGTR